MNNIQRNFKKKSQLRRARPGIVEGPGGPVDDMVGPVMLSSDEYVLPADTTAAVGVDNLDDLVDATHVPAELQRQLEMDVDMGKKNMRIALRGLADGGDPNSDDRRPSIAEQINFGGAYDNNGGFFNSLRNLFSSSTPEPTNNNQTTPYLGTGMLQRAAEGLADRKNRIQQQLDMYNRETGGMADGRSPLRMMYAADGYSPEELMRNRTAVDEMRNAQFQAERARRGLPPSSPRMGPNMPVQDEITRNAAKDVAARRAADTAAEQARRTATTAGATGGRTGAIATSGSPSTSLLRRGLGITTKILGTPMLALEATDTATDAQMEELSRQYAERNGGPFFKTAQAPIAAPRPSTEQAAQAPSVRDQPGAAAVPGTLNVYSAASALRGAAPTSEQPGEDVYASRISDINSLFDARMREIAKSPLRTKRDVYKMQELSELEQARADALRQEADRIATLRGQDIDVEEARLAALGKAGETAAQRRTATRGVLKDTLGDEGYAWWERAKRQTFDPRTVERINNLSPEDQTTMALNMEALSSGRFEQVGGGYGPTATVGGFLGFLSGGKGKLGAVGSFIDSALSRAPGPLKAIGQMGAFEKVFGKLGATVLGTLGGGYVAGEADNRALDEAVALPMIDPQSGNLVTRELSYRELASMTFPQLYDWLTGSEYAIAGTRAGELAPYQIPDSQQATERLRQLGADIQYMGPRM